jgi:prepilin-type N-terminal cleavage/methylation domain-containing protein
VTRANRCLPPRTRRGFTMIEVLAAVLLTSIVISVAVSFQINLGTTTAIARERLRTQRHAVALLDRISRDLAGAYFIAATDNAARKTNPWIFLSDRHFGENGNADAIKFITRNYQPQDLDGHSSDLAVVAYYLNPMEDSRGYELMRWRKPHMPQVFDPTFPELDDPDADVVGENLAHFALSMIDVTGAEVSEWNSSLKQGRAALPIGVTIEIAMLDPREITADPDAEDDDNFDPDDEDEANIYSKTVVLPLRPLDWTFLEREARAGAAFGSSEDFNMENLEAEIYARYDAGESPEDIADDFDKRGFPRAQVYPLIIALVGDESRHRDDDADTDGNHP